MKNFNKLFLTTAIFVVASIFILGVNVPTAKAVTAQELQVQIQALLQQIQQLQQQLTEIQGEVPPAWCHDFNVNLRYEDSGAEVEALQEALKKQGFSIADKDDTINYFGSFTASAVVGFQEKYASEILDPWGLEHGTGYVGNTTRAKLNELYGCEVLLCTDSDGGKNYYVKGKAYTSNQVQYDFCKEGPGHNLLEGICDGGVPKGFPFMCPNGCEDGACEESYIKVLSPNGGEKWEVGKTYEIKWNSSGVDEVFITIFNHGINDSCRLQYEKGLPATQGRYFWKIEGGRCPLSTFIGSKIKVRVWSGEIKDESDNYFSIVEPTTSCHTTPLWSWDYCSGDCKCDAGEGDCDNSEDCNTGYCAKDVGAKYGQDKYIDVCEEVGITCTDSDGGKDYFVKGTTKGLLDGEEGSRTDHCGSVSSELLEEFYCDGANIAYVHAYECPNGCSDGACKKEEKPYIKVLSPNGGEVWQIGNIYQIKWDSGGVDRVSISITDHRHIGIGSGGSMSITSMPVPASMGYYDWTVPSESGLPRNDDGSRTSIDKYKINITEAWTITDSSGTVHFTYGVKDSSDNYFSIVKPAVGTVCTDSDGGKDYYTKGRVLVTKDGVPVPGKDATDYCPDESVVMEYICTNGDALGVSYKCPYGCEDGACKRGGIGTLNVTTLDFPKGRMIPSAIHDFVWATAALNVSESNEDINVTSITLTDFIGGGGAYTSIDNAEIWADLNDGNSSRGDIYETKISNTEQPSVSTQNYVLNQSLLIKKGIFIRVALVADFRAYAVIGSTHRFTFSNVSAFGAISGATIVPIYSGNGQTMTVAEKGALIISTDASSPISDIVIGGQTATLGIFRLSANNVEGLDLDQIYITIKKGAGYIDVLYFYDKDTLIATTPGGNIDVTAIFDDGTLTIPAGGYKNITVNAKMLPIDGTVVKNNSPIQVALSSFDAVQTTGLSSAYSINSGSQTAYGNIMYLFESRPYFSVNANSPSGDLFPSSQTLLAIFDVFQAKLPSAKNITFENADGNSLTVMVDAQINDVDIDSMSFTIKDGYSNVLDNKSINITSDIIQDSVKFTFNTNNFTILADQTKQLYIYGDTTNFEDDGDFIQLWLDDKEENIDWGINGTGSYNHGNIIFRGDIYAGALINPSGICTDECSYNGERRCYGNTGYQTCGYYYDDDPCLEWSADIGICEAGRSSCGYGTCSSTQLPNWYCSGEGNCFYNCVEDSSCLVTACTDSDGSSKYKYNIKGVTIGTNGEFTDSCQGTQLTEYYCVDNTVKSYYNQSVGCKDGAYPVSCSKNPYCFDSDGGYGGTYQYNIKGQSTIVIGDTIEKFNDYCVGDKVIEYVCKSAYPCSGSILKSVSSKCLYGCENGACKQQAVGLGNIEDQLASISNVISEIIEKMKELIGR